MPQRIKKKFVGRVTHFFTNLNVALIELEDEIREGNEIAIEGAGTKFTQKISGMQIKNKSVGIARKGQFIGLRVKEKVRENYRVFRLEE